MNMGDMNMHDLFENMFSGGGFGGGRQKSGRSRGSDVELPMTISFMDAVKGIEKEVSFNAKLSCHPCHGSGAAPGSKETTCKKCNGRGTEVLAEGFIPIATTCRACGGEGKTVSDPCKSCRGSGTTSGSKKVNVKIPAGVDDGMKIRLVGQGDAGGKGGKAGNLFIVLTVTPDRIFKREGIHVHTDVPVSMSQAVLGGTVKVPTLTGEVLEIKVSPGTQPAEKRVLKGKGIPQVGGIGKGNQYIHFHVEIPRKLNEKQKQLMEEFAKEEPEDPGFLGKMKDYFK
eukprot:TRINITY_DN4747_c0_g1_i2.p1 TRINITY_DN4747_c0_g1~~TRINITY_DN4747_c0_g1_i2.p1  ORF type:complete len:284 (-),score=87.47 TRINITY_DN4747_c0_g1_i2:75-926(-)